MKKAILILAILGFANLSCTQETLSEKAQDAGNDISRSAQSGINRTAEAVCGALTGDSKVECLAKEAKNRLEEGADAAVDKASEVKNELDTDGK